MTNTATLLILITLLPFKVHAAENSSAAWLHKGYDLITKSGMQSDYSQICPSPSENSSGIKILKECWSEFPLTSNNMSYAYQTPNYGYPLTTENKMAAEDITNKSETLLQSMDTILDTNNTSFEGPGLSPYQSFDNLGFMLTLAALRAKCLLDLNSDDTALFLKNFERMNKFISLHTRCMHFYNLYFIRTTFFINNNFVSNFIKSANQNIYFYKSILNSLCNEFNFPKALLSSTNIGALYLLHKAEKEAHEHPQLLLYISEAFERIAKAYTILAKPYPDGIVELRQFEKTHPEGTHNHDYPGIFFSAYGPDLFNYTWAYQAQRDLERARIMTALAIYYKTHAGYPDTLDQLAPDILKQVPSNPMTDKPFKYILLPNGEYDLRDE